jgi:hypothetical protein
MTNYRSSGREFYLSSRIAGNGDTLRSWSRNPVAGINGIPTVHLRLDQQRAGGTVKVIPRRIDDSRDQYPVEARQDRRYKSAAILAADLDRVSCSKLSDRLRAANENRIPAYAQRVCPVA